MFDRSPLLLWSEVLLHFWAVSPSLQNIRQCRTWRKLAKGYNENIDMFYIAAIWNKNIDTD